MKDYTNCPFHPMLFDKTVEHKHCGLVFDGNCLKEQCPLVQQQKEIEKLNKRTGGLVLVDVNVLSKTVFDQQKEIEKQAVKLKYLCKVIIILMEGLHASDFNKLPAFKDKELCTKIQDLIKEMEEE